MARVKQKGMIMQRLLPATAIGAIIISVNSYGLTLSSPEFNNGGQLKDKHAACVYSTKKKQVIHGRNASPALKWSNAPATTQSFALIATDPDVPVDRRNVNKPGKIIAYNTKRRLVYHWIVIDIPRHVRKLRSEAGSLAPLNVGHTVSQPRNTWAYVVRYADRVRFSDSYVGPCPPNNDQRIHRYRFQLFALNVKSVPKGLNKMQVLTFIKQHTIQSTQLLGLKSNTPKIKKQ